LAAGGEHLTDTEIWLLSTFLNCILLGSDSIHLSTVRVCP
jgi:hypothetical protein